MKSLVSLLYFIWLAKATLRTPRLGKSKEFVILHSEDRLLCFPWNSHNVDQLCSGNDISGGKKRYLLESPAGYFLVSNPWEHKNT